MEHLLRDGGDLDSMDRSLTDYNQVKILNHTHTNQEAPPTNGQNGHASSSSPDFSPPPPPPVVNVQNADLLSPSNSGTGSLNAAISITPATPLPSPLLSPEGGVNVMPMIKRDLVVRFTEQKNSVSCEMAKTSNQNKIGRGSENHSNSTATPPIMFKEQYEVQHYSRHPHGPMSPCDSENSVCNRSRENLIETGKTDDEI